MSLGPIRSTYVINNCLLYFDVKIILNFTITENEKILNYIKSLQFNMIAKFMNT